MAHVSINTTKSIIQAPHIQCSHLVHKIPLRQRQRLRGLRSTHLPIRLDRIPLWIDLHFRARIVELHVALANVPAVLDSLDALAQVVGFDDARVDGGLGHECYAGGGDERGEHGAHDDGFDGGDGGVGVALK
jgi:hypothetical protein